jgi:pimeloyl-ACP methyl ester carboxylesterase
MSQARPSETAKSTGFGLKTPQRSSEFSMPLTSAYSFDRLAATLNAFTQALKIRHFALYVFDYGAPTGFRLAMAHPDRVSAIVSQNGNAYEEGLGDAWGPIRKYWAEPMAENREVLRKNILTLEGTRWQYTHGVGDPESVPPKSYALDAALLERPGNKDIQLDLFLDYAANVEIYPAFQDYFRKAKPPLLAIWGKNDRFFIPAGAEAFRKDILSARIEFLDTGHFAIETHAIEIAAAMKEFLAANGVSRRAEGASQRIPLLRTQPSSWSMAHGLTVLAGATSALYFTGSRD